MGCAGRIKWIMEDGKVKEHLTQKAKLNYTCNEHWVLYGPLAALFPVSSTGSSIIDAFAKQRN